MIGDVLRAHAWQQPLRPFVLVLRDGNMGPLNRAFAHPLRDFLLVMYMDVIYVATSLSDLPFVECPICGVPYVGIEVLML